MVSFRRLISNLAPQPQSFLAQDLSITASWVKLPPEALPGQLAALSFSIVGQRLIYVDVCVPNPSLGAVAFPLVSQHTAQSSHRLSCEASPPLGVLVAPKEVVIHLTRSHPAIKQVAGRCWTMLEESVWRVLALPLLLRATLVSTIRELLSPDMVHV